VRRSPGGQARGSPQGEARRRRELGGGPGAAERGALPAAPPNRAGGFCRFVLADPGASLPGSTRPRLAGTPRSALWVPGSWVRRDGCGGPRPAPLAGGASGRRAMGGLPAVLVHGRRETVLRTAYRRAHPETN